jgi:sporulation protein YlmC with PRC-barrel domain
LRPIGRRNQLISLFNIRNIDMRLALVLAALLVATQLVAQQATTTDRTDSNDPNLRTPSDATTTTPASRPATYRDRDARAGQAKQKVVRASKIIGINVKNKADEDLGSINDIVFDPRDGRIVYAAVSMGGFLGVGDKLFAVPWEALECREVDGEQVAYLDIDKNRMENAQGFNEDNWPDMANDRWRAENDRRYRLQRSRTHEVLKPTQPDAQPRAEQPATESQPRQPQQ